jgi:N-acetylmuramic acid 6-phosphate etherase
MTERLVRWWDRCDTTRMTPLTLRESDCYIQGGRLLYETKDDLAISILTDTTERSPTFSMLPFENSREPADPRSLCYLYMPKAIDSAEAWQALLLRPPRTLEWKENSGIASLTRLLGFDFSRGLSERRLSGGTANSRFVIARENGLLWLRLEALEAVFDISGLSPLSVHLVLKMLLNAHSTLVMGRLGRFDGNIMTFVRPSNNKLIDRAVRYARLLLQRNAVEIPYETAVAACIELLERLPPDASVVNAIVSRFADPLKSVEFIL